MTTFREKSERILQTIKIEKGKKKEREREREREGERDNLKKTEIQGIDKPTIKIFGNLL